MNGYGNWDFLGAVNDFTIIYPKEPSVRHIGLFNSHLKSYYPQKTLKDNAIEISTGHLNNIKNIIKDFENRLYKVIQTTGFIEYSKKTIMTWIKNIIIRILF